MEYIKSFIPLEILYYLNYFSQLFHQLKLTEGCNPRIYYLDAPDYPNLGDQAIAVAIKEFAEKKFPEYEFVEILQKNLLAYSNWLRNNIKENDIIFLTGGGNMGNRYRIYEATRRYVISHFKNNKIIVFPQSISYTNDIFGRLSRRRSKTIYSRNRHLTVCAREEYSYHEIRNLYKNNNVVLCPDIVLSMNKRPGSHGKHSIGLCLRDDSERMMSNSEKEKLYIYIQNNFGTENITDISTISTEKEFCESNREVAVKQKIDEIGSCKLLITDRLHATIFAYLSNTPCLVFQNNNKKIIGTMNWLQGVKTICMVDNVDLLDEKAHSVLNAEIDSEVSFNHLIIRKIVQGLQG